MKLVVLVASLLVSSLALAEETVSCELVANHIKNSQITSTVLSSVSLPTHGAIETGLNDVVGPVSYNVTFNKWEAISGYMVLDSRSEFGRNSDGGSIWVDQALVLKVWAEGVEYVLTCRYND